MTRERPAQAAAPAPAGTPSGGRGSGTWRQDAPTAPRNRTQARARLRLKLLAALLAASALAACTTAREREDPRNIVGALRFKSVETERHFQHNYRSGNLYLDFRPVMTADAIFQDQRYRALFVDTLRRRYLIGEKETEAMLREQEGLFDAHFEFLVFLYGGSNVPVRLNDRDSTWKLLLRDDDGDVLAPVTMRGIRVDSPTYRYIQGYFSGLDRWTQAYVVQFPKIEKTLAGQAIGQHPVELLVTGLEGTITMRWEDPRIFYRTPEGMRLPAEGEGAPTPAEAPRQASTAPAEENPPR